jgi:hypothetical protein
VPFCFRFAKCNTLPDRDWVPSGKRLHSYGKSPCIFHGTIHYFYGHFQYQIVSLPEGNLSTSYHILVVHPGRLAGADKSHEIHPVVMGAGENSGLLPSAVC